MIVGTFAVRNSMFDVATLFVSGILGFIFIRIGVNRGLLILGFVLGDFLEKAIVRSLLVSRGSFLVFIDRPVSAITLAIIFLVAIAMPGWKAIRARH